MKFLKWFFWSLLLMLTFSCQTSREKITRHDHHQNWQKVVQVDGYAQIYEMQDGLVDNIWITYPDDRLCYDPSGVKKPVREVLKPRVAKSTDDWLHVRVEVYPDLDKANWREHFYRQDFKKFTESIRRELRGEDAVIHLDFVSHIREEGSCQVVGDGVVLDKILVEIPEYSRSQIWVKGVPMRVLSGDESFTLSQLFYSFNKSAERNRSRIAQAFIESAQQHATKIDLNDIYQILEAVFPRWKERQPAAALELVVSLGKMLSNYGQVEVLVRDLKSFPAFTGDLKARVYTALKFMD